MAGRKTTNDQLARTVARVVGKTARAAVAPTSFSGTTGDAERELETARLDALRNTMDDVGQMLYGEDEGALATLPAPADELKFLGSDGPDVDGKYRPKWHDVSEISGTVATLDDVGDVDVPAPADGDVLTWDAGTSTWIPTTPTGGGSIAVQSAAVDVVNPATALNFSADFDVTDETGGVAGVALAVPPVSLPIAESNVTGLVADLAALAAADFTGDEILTIAVSAITPGDGISATLSFGPDSESLSLDLAFVLAWLTDTLVEGSNITITPVGDTLVIASTGGSSIVVQEGDSTVVAVVTTLDFDTSDFNVAETPTGEANISLAYGTTAGTPAEGSDARFTDARTPTDHNHTGTGDGGALTTPVFVDSTGGSTPASGFSKLFPVVGTPGLQQLEWFTADAHRTILERDQIIVVRNVSGATIDAGVPVYQTGVSSAVPTIAKAKADALATSRVLGITADSIANNGYGRVTAFGVANFDTTALASGLLYLDAATAGAMTATPPVWPNYVVALGMRMASGAGSDFFANPQDIPIPSHNSNVSLGFGIGDGINVITAGSAGWFKVDFACTWLQWDLTANESGSIALDVRRTTYSAWDGFATHPASGDSISSGGTQPALSSATKNQDSTLSGYTVSINAEDIIQVQVTGTPANVKHVLFDMKLQRTA